MTTVPTRPPLVYSNSVAIPFTEERFVPLPDSSALLGDAAALRARLAEDGALHLRGVLDPDEIWALRAAYFGRFPPGYLRPGTDPAAGVLGEEVVPLPPYGVPGHPAYEFVRSTAFLRFVDQPALRLIAETVLGEPVHRLARVILRHFDRRSGKSSRAHVDHTYMDRGSGRVVTMWLPIGHAPLETGGLVYLEGSHRLTPEELAPLRSVTDRPHDQRPLSHDLNWVGERIGRRWLWADYEAGDIALHGPHTVHAALDNATDAMRMSVDVRFAVRADRADERWLRPWAADDGA
ncbi:phytanoyl-CoA dioxygenase family protein [Dactylosporangium aurantiacum]|uniref:Phytanoyl-CoA dioxygenase family protein n=1 Tax=Dactylosporangium aurantiacum TaxID=35754 RepID=A0A9Q9IKV3_9ACTN|nr:phytanoyl-CoA dioxygenase family protein [Dactylosporangium aurantiacum]MDG6102987.1 phytanoyl-CoA dioxygenase family protein [Dactylosporangium aurantiacum]UWZ57501.1 phytanoyl-CoA dioxygenase family protein [Dactylosporangium aurantiacum]